MRRRLLNIILLFVLAATIAAFVLGTSGVRRWTGSVDSRRALEVHGRLNLIQAAPAWNYYSLDAATGATLGAASARVIATLDARYEEVEGFSATVYDLEFEGTYVVRYGGPGPTTTVELVFPFPEGLGTLNDVYLLVDGAEPANAHYSLGSIVWQDQAESPQEREISVHYRARGIGSFEYALDRGHRLEHLDVNINVRGIGGSEVPADSLPATKVERDGNGDALRWEYDALIADRDVRVVLPARQGFAQRVAALQVPLLILGQLSPLLVVLFVGSLYAVHRLSGIWMPFSHYLLAGLGYFLFYPTLSALSSAVELPVAGAVASGGTTALLMVFLGRAVGWRRTWHHTLVLSVAFLGLFSVGAVSQLRGLMISAGGLLLVGLLMVLAARHRVARPSAEAPSADAIEDQSADPGPAESPELAAPPSPRYCPRCGAPLGESFAYCPACGHNVAGFQRCSACGREHYLPPEAGVDHCPACGSPFPTHKGGEL